MGSSCRSGQRPVNVRQISCQGRIPVLISQPSSMKVNTHPTYYTDAKIVCACGNTIEVGSTVKEIHVELCSVCHPFYTGKQNLIDTSGRIEKYEQKTKATAEKAGTSLGKKAKTAKRAAQKAAKKATKQEVEA